MNLIYLYVINVCPWQHSYTLCLSLHTDILYTSSLLLQYDFPLYVKFRLRLCYYICNPYFFFSVIHIHYFQVFLSYICQVFHIVIILSLYQYLLHIIKLLHFLFFMIITHCHFVLFVCFNVHVQFHIFQF